MIKKITCLVICFVCITEVFPQYGYDRVKVSDYLQNQQYEEVIAYLLPMAKQDSVHPAILNNIGYALFMNEQAMNASPYFERALRIDSANTMSLYYLSRIYAIDSPAKAAVFMDRLISIQPTKAVWRRSMGDLLRRQKLIDSALVFYEKAYQLTPSDYKNAVAFGEALIDKKEYHAADTIISMGIERDSLNAPLLKLQVRSAYESGHYDSAIIPGEKLIRLDETYVSSFKQLALAYYELKKYYDCIRVCEYMLQNQMESTSIYYYEAMAFGRLKDFRHSNELLDICLSKSISKEAETYFYQIASNDEELRLFRKAIANYDTAYYLFRNPLMKYYCGRICEIYLHETSLAQKYYQEYLALARPSSLAEKRVYANIKSNWGRRTSNKKSGKNSINDSLSLGR